MATDGEREIIGDGGNAENTGLDFGSATNPADTSNPGGTGDDTVFDPERHISPDKRNLDGTFRRKRARKGTGGNTRTASSNKRSQKSAQISVSGIETLLVGIHYSLAAVTKCPELALEDDEKGPLSKAVAEVAALYPMPDMTEKAIKWMALIMVAGPMYLAKGSEISERKKSEKARNVKEVLPPNPPFDSNMNFNFTPPPPND